MSPPQVLDTSKTVVTSDTPNKPIPVDKSKSLIPNFNNVRWSMSVITLTVDQVKMGEWDEKTIQVYSLSAPETIKAGDKGDWFISTHAYLRWQGKNGPYWKQVAIFPGGPDQARAEFNPELANKYAGDRAENIARIRAMRAKIKP